MMGARTGDNNAPVAGEKRDGLVRRKHPLSSSGAIKKCPSRPERSLPSSGPFSFIKVMIGVYTEALIIPPKARPKLMCLLDRNVCLEDAEMRTFLVEVSVFNGALAFRHGWDQFLSDHCIEYGEVVIFNYTRGLKFSVQIYGKTGCERTCFLRSCQANLKRKRDELETRGSKIFDYAKEPHISILEATTREMPSDVALDFSNSEQPSCGAVTEPYVDGNICENNVKPKAYSAVNQCTIPSDGAVEKNNVNINNSEKFGIQNDNLKKPKDCYVLNCDTGPHDGCGIEHKVNNNVLEKCSIEHDNSMKPHVYPVANCDTTSCELMVEDPTGNPESKTGSINDPTAIEQGTDNLDNSFYYACIDLSKGSKVSKSVGSKANKMKGLKVNKKRDPSKGQLLSAMTSLKSQNKFREDPSTEMDMKEVVPVYSSVPTMDKTKVVTGKSVKLGLKEGKFLGNSKADNLDRLSVGEEKVFLDTETREGNHKSSSISADHVNQSATVRHSNETATSLSGCDLEHLIILDCSSCRFIVNEEGVCFVVEGDLTVEPDLSTIIPIEIDDSNMGTERCKEISPEHDHMSKRSFVEPQVEECFNDLQFSCHTKKHNEKQQGSTSCLAFENSHLVLPTEKAECVADHPVSELIKSPKCHVKNALVGESSQPAPGEIKNKLVAHKGTVGALVKVETVDSVVLSSISPVKLILPIMIPAQPWLELPAALAFKGKKDGGKVVTFRDPSMRSWPVLYHESLRFIGFLGGWFALASANNLQPGDACELEVLAELDMILVHIKE